MAVFREDKNGYDVVDSRNQQEKMVYYPSETFQLVQQREHEPFKAEIHVPEHSRTFKEIEKRFW